MIKNSSEREIYVQGIYRTYFPKLSRSTSLNFGLNYYNYHYYGPDKYNVSKNLVNTLITSPMQMQQNFLSKGIRPYAFAGLNLSYNTEVDDQGVEQLNKGIQQNFGVGILYGLGVEADIKKGFMLKSEFRYENFGHLVMAGIGYNFTK